LHQTLLDGQQSTPLVLTTVAPVLKAADVEPLQKDTQALLDKGLVLTAQGSTYTIAPSDLGDLIVVHVAGPGHWSIGLDQTKVAAVIAQIDDKFKRPAADARFGWENGKVKLLKPVVPGRVIDEKAAIQAVLEKWWGSQVDLPVVEKPITIDAAYLARLNQDLKGVIGQRSISYAGSIPERAHNINLALSKINGTLLMPGDTFSFARQVGPLTLGAGFQWGFAYGSENGKSAVVPSVAGGICQVATTVFQPIFWAGYQIDERHWHMFPMHSYADKAYLGLDATVDPEDGLDLQFTNNSDHALLILAWGDGAQTNLQLIGTKPNWTVKVSPEVITDVTPAPTSEVRTTSPVFARGRQIVLETAQQGLTSHVTRQVVYPDGHVRTLNLVSDYQASPLTVLVGTG
jgi:vancomycin resistance protein YoaR